MIQMTTQLELFLQDRENRKLLEQERLILEVTEAVCRLMNARGVTRAQLAQKIGCSPSNVSQLLDGDNNFTLRSIADVLFALDARLTCDVQATSSSVPFECYEWHPDRRNHYSGSGICGNTWSDSAKFGDCPRLAA